MGNGYGTGDSTGKFVTQQVTNKQVGFAWGLAIGVWGCGKGCGKVGKGWGFAGRGECGKVGGKMVFLKEEKGG